jgi:HEAT repeat protein
VTGLRSSSRRALWAVAGRLPGRQWSGGLPSLRLLPLLLVVGCARSDEAWIADLSSPDAHVRGLAAIALAVQSPESAQPALPVLLETIDRSRAGLEREAAHALVLSGAHHVEALLDALVADPLMTEHRRGAILNALLNAGPHAAPAVARRMAGDARDLAGPLGEVLVGIGGPSALPLGELLEGSQDPAVRRYAAFLLLKLGPRAAAARPALERAADDPDPELAGVAAQALRALAPRRPGGPR